MDNDLPAHSGAKTVTFTVKENGFRVGGIGVDDDMLDMNIFEPTVSKAISFFTGLNDCMLEDFGEGWMTFVHNSTGRVFLVTPD